MKHRKLNLTEKQKLTVDKSSYEQIRQENKMPGTNSLKKDRGNLSN